MLTTACASVNKEISLGSIVVIKDHVNLLGMNPLLGNVKKGVFPNMCNVYPPGLRALVMKIVKNLRFKVSQGVVTALPGPSYETLAESKMLRKLGVDCVTMSTVPEAMYAHYLDRKVLGIGCIVNRCAEPVSHTIVNLRTGYCEDVNFI